mgnify:CR=1 FL=1
MTTQAPILEKAAETARKARLTGALMQCHEGRKLLEEARMRGIDVGGSSRLPQQASPLHLSSTALFMIQDVYALCAQVRPDAPQTSHYDRSSRIAQDLIRTANRTIFAEPVVQTQPRKAIRALEVMP